MDKISISIILLLSVTGCSSFICPLSKEPKKCFQYAPMLLGDYQEPREKTQIEKDKAATGKRVFDSGYHEESDREKWMQRYMLEH